MVGQCRFSSSAFARAADESDIGTVGVIVASQGRGDEVFYLVMLATASTKVWGMLTALTLVLAARPS